MNGDSYGGGDYEESLNEPPDTQTWGVMGLDLDYNKLERGVAGREDYGRWKGGCKASQQHRANHKGERGGDEIRANLQEEQNPSIRERKQEMRSIPLLCSLQKI